MTAQPDTYMSAWQVAQSSALSMDETTGVCGDQPGSVPEQHEGCQRELSAAHPQAVDPSGM